VARSPIPKIRSEFHFFLTMRTDTIRLLAENGNFLGWTDDDDARAKKQSGFWQETYNPRTGNFYALQKIKFLPKPSDHSSPSGISASESLANVGIWDGLTVEEGGRVPVGKLRAARQKIRMWPFEGDTKAVRVSCLARA
jgi:hypothetical protein